MSNYNARRAPNVSQYVADLNQPAPDLSQFEEFDSAPFDSLASLEFFDLDAATGFPGPAFPHDEQHAGAKIGMSRMRCA